MASGSNEAVARRLRLRCATTEVHDRLDTLVQDAGFLSDPERYASYVAATWRARRPLEAMLDDAGASDVYGEWPQRRISDALAADLRDLDISAPPAPLPGPSGATGLPEILGTLYVLEGSALGARILGRVVDGIGMNADKGARHIAAQTSDPRAWGRFVSVLDEATLSEEEEKRCVAAAHSAFGEFERSYREAIPAE